MNVATASRYGSYAYAYPHKSAYRRILPPPTLGEVWRDEPRDGRFAYVHVPFCEARCGFCNLFTEHRPSDQRAPAFLDALEREAAAVASEIGPACYARAAVGGGTPTLLSPAQLDRLVAIMARLGVQPTDVPSGIETSPSTATRERLAVLAGHGFDRVSIGVQSFVVAETRALARPQDPTQVHRALDAIRAASFPRLNVDLIYGIDGQTPASFRYSIDETLRHRPEEVYLYPLYVRPLTGLGRSTRTWDDARHDLYLVGRDHLLAHGYGQLSMRSFALRSLADLDGPDYCCQDDGMVGIGVGSRSYTRTLHYSRDYAVGRSAVTGIIDDYVARPPDDFRRVEHGFRLDTDEQRRRWVIKSLLRRPGLDRAAYRIRFATEAIDDLPGLRQFEERGWATITDRSVELTADGLGWSDRIGPELTSPAVRLRSERFELR